MMFSIKSYAQSHRQTINGPTWLTSAGPIVLLIFSTAFETPARDKQTITDRKQDGHAGQARQTSTELIHLLQLHIM